MLNPLDDQTLIRLIDTEDMLAALASFPAQCAEAAGLADDVDLSAVQNSSRGPISEVVTLGMGGSGIGGDIAKALLETGSSVPIIVNKGYELPAFVSASTLVIAVSYSGETEETLAAFDAALSAGARIVAITSGGAIARKAEAAGAPIVRVPTGLQPRAAVGYLALPIIIVLRRLGLCADDSGDIDEAIALLETLIKSYGPAVEADNNRAKRLADELSGAVPIVYGGEGMPAVAALRWKCQLNENSKVPAFWNSFPEMNHNELVGWQELSDVTVRFHGVVLKDGLEGARVKARIGLSLPMIEQNLGGVTEIEAKGQSRLARFMSLVCLGDYASVYIAILSGVDPTPVARIQELKSKLKEIG
jgi:glucose/mannose-6-phosphate isomerase